MRKFDFNKSYEDIEIAGESYKIDMSDNKIKEYQLAIHKYFKKAQELQQVNVEELDFEEQQQKFEESIELQKSFIETVLGEGTFDDLYEKSGKSSINMVELVEFLGEIIGEKVQKLKEKQKQKYVRK